MTVGKAVLIIFGVYMAWTMYTYFDRKEQATATRYAYIEQKEADRAEREEKEADRRQQREFAACDKLIERTGHGCGL